VQKIPFPNVFTHDKHIVDFNWLVEKLREHSPFTFVRFSDGEMEILHNRKLEISGAGVAWHKGASKFMYPNYDHKKFNPESDGELREALLESARFRNDFYIKGIPAHHNDASLDRDFMIQLNSGIENLTYADLLINANYKRFIAEVLPLIRQRENVAVIANYRANVRILNEMWEFLPLPDNAFDSFSSVTEQLTLRLENLPPGHIVLSSASSLSNVLGRRLRTLRPDLTFIDVGTALHPHLNLQDSKRLYLSQDLTWHPRNWRQKLAYAMSSSKRFSW